MRAAILAAALIAALPASAQNPFAPRDDAPVKGRLNTLGDIHRALNRCWVWPSEFDSSGNMELTVMLSFKADGEIFGGRITHINREVSDNERELYLVALENMIRRCSHLPVSPSLGEAIAGRPFIFHIVDTRKQKRA